MKHKTASFVLALIVLCCALRGGVETYRVYQSMPSTSLLMKGTRAASEAWAPVPVEESTILPQLEMVHSLPGTVKWWTGPWAFRVDYYRPIPSVLWWMEYRAFGPNGLAPFLIIHAALHVAFVMLLWGFLCALCGKLKGTLATVLYATSALVTLADLPAPVWALSTWIDDPEPLYAIPFIACLWCFLLTVRSSDRRWLAAAVAAFVVGSLCKEAAYIALPIAGMILWLEGRLRSWPFLVPMALAAGVMLTIRHFALSGAPWYLDANGMWQNRLWHNLAPYDLYLPVHTGDTLALGIALTTLAVFAAALKSKREAWGALGLAALCFVRFGFYWRDLPGSPFLALMIAAPWLSAGPLAAMVYLLWRFIVRREKLQVFGYLWVLATYLPLIIAPVTKHGLYMVGVGWALWAACAFVDLLHLMGTADLAAIKYFEASRLTRQLDPVN